jgi:hypothetical protein
VSGCEGSLSLFLGMVGVDCWIFSFYNTHVMYHGNNAHEFCLYLIFGYVHYYYYLYFFGGQLNGLE